LANWEFLSTEGFQPHGMCLLWRPDIFWAHLGADFVIALSYFSIPLAIVYVAYRRPDVEHGWLLYLFGGFIVACGITHVFGIWTMFVPDYGIEAVLKLATAAISSATAVALWPLMPRILAVPSPRMLAQQNLRLAQEIHERMAAERVARRQSWRRPDKCREWLDPMGRVPAPMPAAFAGLSEADRRQQPAIVRLAGLRRPAIGKEAIGI